jgi:DNA-directed RNA polymerase subunit RPC12/RpoP
MFNAYCVKCKKMVQVPSEDSKCPNCNSEVEIKGKVLKVITSNGPYAPHL